MKNVYLIFFFLLILLFNGLVAQTPDLSSEELAEFEAYVMQHIEDEELVGLSVAWSHAGKEWAKGYGYADLENKIPATAQSSYRMASVSKPFTAVGLLKLVEEGRVNLDAEVQTYLPWYPQKQWSLTSRHLLGHLGGVSHYRNYSAEAQTNRDMTTREALEIFMDWELLHAPGTRYRYTTYGYNVLWAVMEAASGQSYQDFMKSEVWGPAGMETATVDYLRDLIQNRVNGYTKRDGEIINSLPVSTSLKIGGGGTRASVIDMVRFAQALSDGKILKQETLDQMWRPMVTSNNFHTGYGMGWGIDSQNGRRLVRHSGAQEGTRTVLAHFPALDLSVAVASNLESSNPRQYAIRLLRALLDENGQLPAPYFNNREDEYRYDALRHTFSDGLSYYDYHKEAQTDDKRQLANAFAYLNSFADDRKISKKRDDGPERLRNGQHPAGNWTFERAGSYMASTVVPSLSAKELEDIRQGGPLQFANAYVEAADKNKKIHDDYRFSKTYEKYIKTLAKDWKKIQQSDLATLEISGTDDPAVLQGTLEKMKKRYKIYPDYTSDLGEAVEFNFASNPLKAQAFAQLAYDIYPNSATSTGYLGMLNILSGDESQGESLLRKSMTIDPDGTGGQSNLNVVAYRLAGGNMVDAGLKLLNMAIKLNPEVANLYDSVGEFYLMKGDTTTAVKYYKEALEKDPDFQNPKDVLKGLGVQH